MEKVIARLVGKLVFDTDVSGLKKFERMMDATALQMKRLDKQAQALNTRLTKLGGQNTNLQRQQAQQAKLTKEQFKQSLEASKLQYVAGKQSLQLQVQQSKAGIAQSKLAQQEARRATQDHKAELARIKATQTAQAFSLKHEQQRLRIQAEAARLAATQHRLLAAADRAKLVSLRLEEKLSRRLQGSNSANSGGGFGGLLAGAFAGKQMSRFHAAQMALHSKYGSSMSGIPAGGLGGAVGSGMAVEGGLGAMGARLSGALGGAAIAVAGMAAAAVTAGVALKKFSDAAHAAGNAATMRQAQFKAIDGTSPQAAEAVFTKLANDLGLNIRATSDAYTRGLQGMVDGGMNLGQGQDVLKGILSYSKASNLGNDDTQGVLRAIGQMLSKGQLYAEEWGSQFSERMAGAQKMGSETWANITNSGLTGDKASAAFKKAMEDGKIVGDKLRQFLIQLSARMEKDANRGGKLDVAKASIESNQNRVANIQDLNLVAAAEYNDGRLTKSAQKLAASWSKFNEDLKPLYEVLSGPASRVNDILTSAVEWARTQIPKITQLVEDISGYISSIADSKEASAVAEQLSRLINNLDPVFSTLSMLLGKLFGLSSDASITGMGTTAGTLLLINEFIEGIPNFIDRIAKAVESIQAKIDAVKKFLGIDGVESEETKERRKSYSGTPQWEKPEEQPRLMLPPPNMPSIPQHILDLGRGVENINRAALPQPAANAGNAAPTINDNSTKTFNVSVNGTGLSAEEIAQAIQVESRRVTQHEIAAIFTTTKGSLVQVAS